MWLIAIYFENESLSIFAIHICLVVKKDVSGPTCLAAQISWKVASLA